MASYSAESRKRVVREQLATAEVMFSLAQGEARVIAEREPPGQRVDFARGLCTAVLGELWTRQAAAAGCEWPVRAPAVLLVKGYASLIDRLASALATLAGPQAGFLAGRLYTTLLPDSLRKSLGAFYTPPPLVDRLLEMVTHTGFDWQRGRIIDPACGGAAFLAAVAPKLVSASPWKGPAAVMDDIENRLVGVEIDPFAAWMAMVLLDIALLRVSTKANRRLKPLVLARDAFELPPAELGKFDLVIGNPPYGKLTLSSPLRTRFSRSLFGHANLYGLFTDLGVQLAREGGLVAYVTPTSFLGGEYFKKLRSMLCTVAPLRQVDFVQDREGVFEGVLQETMLTVFARGTSPLTPVPVSVLQCSDSAEPVKRKAIGNVIIRGDHGGPWIMPRAPEQEAMVRQLNAMPHRLADYSFAVSTGQLVWNRHKDQLRPSFGAGCYPIIWAESVGANGVFRFQAVRRNHLPYLKVKSRQEFLINQEPCVLVQRTTAKEQRRRLIAAVILNSFIVEYPGFVVENHLNMIFPVKARPPIALGTLAALLNSESLDGAFRCINGSVAVSAYELNSLPLPSPEQMRVLQNALLAGGAREEIEALIADFYRPDHQTHELNTASYPIRAHRKMVA